MSLFWNVTLEMADGSVRPFVAREDDCWLRLRPLLRAVTTSDNIRGLMPPEQILPRTYPIAEHLDAQSADLGVEVTVEDWDAVDFPTLTLRMTAQGWVEQE